MKLSQWAGASHNSGEVLTDRQQRLLATCLEGILGMDKDKVEDIYKEDNKTNFSGDEQVTAQYPSIKFCPTGIGTSISINGVDATDVSLW